MYKEGFASKIKKARNDTGFTQREVAAELNMNYSTIANQTKPKAFCIIPPDLLSHSLAAAEGAVRSLPPCAALIRGIITKWRFCMVFAQNVRKFINPTFRKCRLTNDQ